MRKTLLLTLLAGLAILALLVPPVQLAAAQQPAPTATSTATSTSTQAPPAYPEPPTVTPITPYPIRTATKTPAVTDRPVVVVESYYLDKDTIRAGDSFTLFVELKNQGQATASNLILNLINESFLPQDNGGVVSIGSLKAGGSQTISHAFLVSAAMAGQPVGTIPAKLSYTGPDGTAFSEAYAITLQLKIYNGPYATATLTPTVTPTATVPPPLRPQLVVSSYKSSVDPLQPGTLFDLEVRGRNLGTAGASAVSVVLGGGVQADASGTPGPGGVSGGSGDLSTFAPLGSSNIFYVGDVAQGAEIAINMHLIVNVSANPGAYALKLSFTYTDPKGVRLVDDQVITLLVYQNPIVETSFYRDPGPLMAMQPNTLPIQVVNNGRKSTILGNLKVSATGGEVTNASGLVGPLDPGGSYTLDVMYVPQQAGAQEIELVIDYTNDFNQPGQIVKKIQIEVQEGAPAQPELTPGSGGNEGGGGGVMPAPVEETFWDKALRFLKGLLGLDSGISQPVNSGPVGGEGTPLPSEGKAVPAPLKMP